MKGNDFSTVIVCLLIMLIRKIISEPFKLDKTGYYDILFCNRKVNAGPMHLIQLILQKFDVKVGITIVSLCGSSRHVIYIHVENTTITSN